MPPSPTSSADSDADSALLSALESSLDSDPSLGAYRAQRLQQLHAEHALAKQLRQEGHGVYTEIKDEKELMERVTGTRGCVVHFFKDGFRRCGIMDGHLKTLSLSPHHIRTLFLRINVTNAPFLVTKLQIKVLPCVIAFVDSLVVDRIVGFEGLGAPEADADADTFPTASLETRLCAAGVLFDASASVSKQPHLLPQNDNGDDADTNRRRDSTGRNLRTGNKGGGGGGGRKNGSGAEDAEDDEWD